VGDLVIERVAVAAHPWLYATPASAAYA
jgi:hypothetical protein